MNVEEQVIAILKKYQPEGSTTELQLADPLNSIGIDSLGMAEVLFEIEDTFGIVIQEQQDNDKESSEGSENTKKESVQFKTINDLIVIVTEYIQKKS